MNITDEYLKMKELQYAKRLKGYTQVFRARYLLLLNGHMSQTEFILFCFIWDVLADWDSRHDEFGMFECKYDLLARNMKWSPTKLRNAVKSLLTKGYILFVCDGKFSVRNFELSKLYARKDLDYYKAISDPLNNTLVPISTDHDTKSNQN